MKKKNFDPFFVPYKNINSQGRSINVQEYRRKSFYDLGLGKGFLSKT